MEEFNHEERVACRFVMDDCGERASQTPEKAENEEMPESDAPMLAMMRQNSLLYMIVRGESLVDFKEQIYVAMWYRAAITHAWVWPVCPCPIDCTLM